MFPFHPILILEQYCNNCIKNQEVCCSKSCGQCGGNSCASFPGGRTKCCLGAIKKSGKVCQKDSDTGCTVPGMIKCANVPSFKYEHEQVKISREDARGVAWATPIFQIYNT